MQIFKSVFFKNCLHGRKNVRSRVQGMKKEFVDEKQRQISKTLEKAWVNVMKIMYCRKEKSTMKNGRKNGYSNMLHEQENGRHVGCKCS